MTSAKAALRLVKLASVVGGQREAGRRQSTDTQSASWCAEVTRCSWLVTTSFVLWNTQLLEQK